MGKPEPTPQRFRRKAKGQRSSPAATEQISDSVASAQSNVDSLLCNNLLDSSITTEEVVSPPEQTCDLTQGLATANGSCDAEAELTDGDIKGTEPSLIGDNDLVAADPAPHEDPDRPTDLCLTSHLPAELSELCHSDITPLCTIQSLDLSACHVQKDDSLVLVLFVSNSSDSAIKHVLLHLDSEQIEVTH